MVNFLIDQGVNNKKQGKHI